MDHGGHGAWTTPHGALDDWRCPRSLRRSDTSSKALVTSSDALVPSSFLLLLVRHLLLVVKHLFLIASCYY